MIQSIHFKYFQVWYFFYIKDFQHLEKIELYMNRNIHNSIKYLQQKPFFTFLKQQ